MPCHEKEVEQPDVHGHHKAGSKGNECIACHMPMTRFAAMGRSDHSMRPPTPAATLAFKSPNACILCHADHDAAWADGWVRKWYKQRLPGRSAAAGRVDRPGPQGAVETPAGYAGRTPESKAMTRSTRRRWCACCMAATMTASGRSCSDGFRIRRRWSAPVRRRPWPVT